MIKWVCALVLVLFAVTVGPAAHAPAEQNIERAGVEHMLAHAPCCPDGQEIERSAAPCSVECSFLPAMLVIGLPRLQPFHFVSRDLLLHSVEDDRLLRPPIG